MSRNGARIVFYEHGSGDHTLILAHPLVYSIATFQPLVEKLCQEFRIITINPRGAGASDPLPERYALREHAEDLRAAIEASSMDSRIVGIGGSRGGTLMMTLAAAYPSLLHKLVLVSTSATPSAIYTRVDWILEVRQLIREGHLDQANRMLAEVNYPEPGTGHLIDHYVRQRRTVPADILLKFLDPDPEDDVAELLPYIHVPTLVMHGMADRRTPLCRRPVSSSPSP